MFFVSIPPTQDQKRFKQTLEKIERAIKSGNSRDTFNIGHKTQNEDTKNNTEN